MSDDKRQATDPARGVGAGSQAGMRADPTRGISAEDPSRRPADPTAPSREAIDAPASPQDSAAEQASDGEVMSEHASPDPQERPDESSGISEDAPAGGVGGHGGQGSGAAEVTTRMGEEGSVGQTAVAATDEDVGVPSDEEISREEREAGGVHRQ
jgi:hypothetical protein